MKTKDIALADGDGDGPEETEIETILIEVAANGFFLTFTLDDGTEEKSVHTDFDELLSAVRSRY